MSLLKVKVLHSDTLVLHSKALIGYEIDNVNSHNCDGIDCLVHSIINYTVNVRFVDDGALPFCFKDKDQIQNFIENLEKLLWNKKEYVLTVNLRFEKIENRFENNSNNPRAMLFEMVTKAMKERKAGKLNIVDSFAIEEV